MSELHSSSSTDQAAAPLDVSVVFATRDRAEQLARTLAAYRALDTRDLRWELIVIDNNSSDDTARVLTEACRGLPLIRLFAKQGGKNRALNMALDRLRGGLAVFTDDDVIPDPCCLQAYIAAAARWPDDVIFGARIEPRFPDGTPTWMRSEQFAFGTTAFARYHPAEHESRVQRHPYGPSFAIRQHILHKRRFAEHLGPQGQSYPMGGEASFLRDLNAEGHRYIYVPKARVEHIVRPEQISEPWLLKRARNKGRGQTYLPSSKKPRCLYIGRVPARLYLAALRSGIRYSVARFAASAERRVKLGIKYELRRGEIEELRRRQTLESRGHR